MITIRVNMGAEKLIGSLDGFTSDARLRINLSIAKRLEQIVVTMFDSSGAAARPKPWDKKADGTPSNLIKTTTLVNSFVAAATPEEASVATPVKYAARHQFGGEFTVPEHDRTIRQAFGRPIDPPKTIRVREYQMTVPARPFFPFDDQGNLTPASEAILVETAEAGIERELQRSMNP